MKSRHVYTYTETAGRTPRGLVVFGSASKAIDNAILEAAKVDQDRSRPSYERHLGSEDVDGEIVEFATRATRSIPSIARALRAGRSAVVFDRFGEVLVRVERTIVF